MSKDVRDYLTTVTGAAGTTACLVFIYRAFSPHASPFDLLAASALAALWVAVLKIPTPAS